MDRFTALTAFRTAAELGSFAATARHLRLSPAAVSKNISELEDDLGVRLFHRTTRRMSLTEEGTLYLERVTLALDTLTDAGETLSALRAEARGTLRVTAPLSITLTCLSTKLPAFLESHPKLRLVLDLDDRRVDLVAGGYDLALRGSDGLEDSSLIARRLTTLEHVLCASPRYLERAGTPAKPEDLEAHEFVRFSRSGHADSWTFRKGRREVRVPVRARYSVASSLAVRDALVEGFGLSLVPRVYIDDDLAAGRLVVLLDNWSSDETALYAVYPSKRYLIPKVHAFVAFLRDVFASGRSH